MQPALVGRAELLGALRVFLDGAAAHGGTLVLTGERGVGRTALLDAAAEAALESGGYGIVLRATAVPFETGLEYATLDQLLLPMRDRVDTVGAAHAAVLRGVLGLVGGPPPSSAAVAGAVAALLASVVPADPVLLVVDDLQWADASTAAVLASLVGGGGRIGLLATALTGCSTHVEAVDPPSLVVPVLLPQEAEALLSRRCPTVTSHVRRRVSAQAAGNPFALLELLDALSPAQISGVELLPEPLPLTDRLRALFAPGLDGLSPAARDLLLILALEPGVDLAAVAATGGQGVPDLEGAEAAGLVTVERGAPAVAFRHPLVPASLLAASTGAERRRAHAVLAYVLRDQPGRRAVHLAQASGEPDEGVAAVLLGLGRGSLDEGDAVGAVASLTQAARMSPDRGTAARRFAEAAYVCAEAVGDLAQAEALVADARTVGQASDGVVGVDVAAAHLYLMGEGDVDTVHRNLVVALETAPVGPGTDDAIRRYGLATLRLACIFGGREELWAPLDAAFRRGTAALHDSGENPIATVRAATAALGLDRLEECRGPLLRLRAESANGAAPASAAGATALLALDELFAGRWSEAERLAGEALAFRESRGHHLQAWPCRYVLALLAAMRGEATRATHLAADMVRWSEPRGTRTIEHQAGHVRTVVALGAGDFDQAYRHAAGVMSPGVVAAHVDSTWLGLDLVEAAVRTRRRTEAGRHVAAMRAAAGSAVSPRTALLLAGAEAFACDDTMVDAFFPRALDLPEAQRRPFERARIQLVHGERLRRARATSRARVQLAAALDTFQTLGALPWAERARTELQATSRTRATAGSNALTSQEREVASLASGGHTNKQIAERLFISPRTVGSHLHQVFRKLDITSRAALAGALASDPATADR